MVKDVPYFRRDYSIITGSGRSGTTWLMSLLDASPLTFCRSEPYGIPTSPFHRVPQLWKAGSCEPPIAEQWDEILSWSSAHIGEKDYGFKHPKEYVHPLAHKMRLATLMAHGKTRRLLGVFQPSLWNGEWSMPWWLGDQRKMERAHAVFKLNIDRRMLKWLLENRPQGRIIHIARHPCGRLNSWLNRFAAKRESEQILAANIERLRKIGEVEPEWRERFGSIETMSFVESEVWFWRYVNESIDAVGSGHPSYLRIIYEGLAGDPLTSSRDVYRFCGLPWDAAVERIIARETGSSASRAPATSRSIASSWKTKLAAEHVETVERIVRGSPIMAWWPNL